MKYKHYALETALAECRFGQRKRYKVTTINWTYATIRGKTHFDTVHKNEYSWTLRYLIRWIRETAEVAEDIIGIVEEGSSPRRRRKNTGRP